MLGQGTEKGQAGWIWCWPLRENPRDPGLAGRGRGSGEEETGGRGPETRAPVHAGHAVFLIPSIGLWARGELGAGSPLLSPDVAPSPEARGSHPRLCRAHGNGSSGQAAATGEPGAPHPPRGLRCPGVWLCTSLGTGQTRWHLLRLGGGTRIADWPPGATLLVPLAQGTNLCCSGCWFLLQIYCNVFERQRFPAAAASQGGR